MTDIYLKSQTIETRQIESELVIVPLDKAAEGTTPSLFFLEDPTSLEIWKLLDGTRTTAQIVQETATAFQKTSNEIHQDVIDFLSDLEKNGIIVKQEVNEAT